MRNLLSALLLCALLLSLPLAADTSVLPATWQPYAGRIDFNQQKQLQGLAFPVRSSGYLQLDNDTLLWHTQTPIDQQVLISGAGVSQLQQGEMQLIAGTEIIGQLMLAVLQQNQPFLHEYFRLTPPDNNCQLLTPVKAPVDQFFSQIELCGDTQLQQIKLLEKTGNNTLIELSYPADNTVPANAIADPQQ